MVQVCASEDRRTRLRESPLNGIDEIEVADNGRTLIVRFFHNAPERLGRRHLRLTGGVAVRNIAIDEVELVESDDPDLPTLAAVSLDRAGDASRYELRVIDLENFDPRYSAASFTFFPDFDDDVDPVSRAAAPPPVAATPPLSYLAKDYAGFRQLMLDRLAVTMPGWTERHIPDVGLMMVEMLAYAADRLSYHQDAVATEAYLGTARRRLSVKRHARLIDYPMHEGCAARALVQLDAGADATAMIADLSFAVGADSDAIQFHPVGLGAPEMIIREACVAMRFHCWGDSGCVLPKGSRAATLVDPAPNGDPALSAGDFLILEIIDLMLGNAPDADPTARHPVRLTHVKRSYDPLLKVPLLEVNWAAADATPIDFPLDAATDAGVQRVTVARGNLVLVAEGRGVVDGDPSAGGPRPVTVGPGRRRGLTLLNPGLSYAAPIQARQSARDVLSGQNPRQAVPLIRRLVSWPAAAPTFSDAAAVDWEIRPDLIESGPDDAHATVEMDDDGVASLRFGDGVCGRDPAGAVFTVAYVVGSGAAGNVGADSIATAASASQPDVADWGVRNPLPAGGGAAAESVARVRLLAPRAFRDDLERAVTADDYAALAVQLEPRVQRAACQMIASGVRKIARIAIDPLGGDAPAPGLTHAVARALEPYRHIGHDIVVVQGEYTPLILALAVTVKHGHVAGHVRAALQIALGSGVNARGAPAPFNPDLLTFGTPILGSPLIAAAHAVEGVESVEIVELARLFDRERGGYEHGVLAMAWNEIPRLDGDPLRPDHGRLELRLTGGRR
jgi:hypothetical protein